MKKLLFIGILISMILASCNETNTSVFSVNQEEVTSTATGSMVLYIDKEGEPFTLTGNLKLIDGMCKVLLVSPVDTVFEMDTVYSLDSLQLPELVYVIDSIYVVDMQLLRDTIFKETYVSPVDIQFDKPFDRIVGEWLFSYEILPHNKIDPFGSYEFTFSYNE